MITDVLLNIYECNQKAKAAKREGRIKESEYWYRQKNLLIKRAKGQHTYKKIGNSIFFYADGVRIAKFHTK